MGKRRNKTHYWLLICYSPTLRNDREEKLGEFRIEEPTEEESRKKWLGMGDKFAKLIISRGIGNVVQIWHCVYSDVTKMDREVVMKRKRKILITKAKKKLIKEAPLFYSEFLEQEELSIDLKISKLK